MLGHHLPQQARLAAVTLTALLLAACGGGGGADASATAQQATERPATETSAPADTTAPGGGGAGDVDITITGDYEDEMTGEGGRCEAVTGPGSVSYTVSADNFTLTAADYDGESGDEIPFVILNVFDPAETYLTPPANVDGTIVVEEDLKHAQMDVTLTQQGGDGEVHVTGTIDCP